MDQLSVDACGVGALLCAPGGRFLMQLRDRTPSVSMAGHWALFGGLVEAGEDARAALVRELREELDFTPEKPPALFSQIAFDLGFAGQGLQRKLFFEVPVSGHAVQAMRLAEGEAMRFFTLRELLLEAKVVPWDLYGVILYARRKNVEAALRPPAVGR